MREVDFPFHEDSPKVNDMIEVILHDHEITSLILTGGHLQGNGILGN